MRENLEAVIVAIVLALLIRQYAVEAFVIPTGSMAPSLLGSHLDLECTNCGFEQPVAEVHVSRTRFDPAPANAAGRCPKCGKVHKTSVSDDAFIAGRTEMVCDACGTKVILQALSPGAPGGRSGRPITAFCSNCGVEFESGVESTRWPAGDVSRGDRILVNKFVYHFQPPQRYEVAVFKFPSRPADNFIKRLAGLPGELIDVRDGDIYADGKIARKPPDAQRALWRVVHDASHVEKDETAGGRKPAWRTEGAAKWERVEDGKAWRGEGAGTTDGWLVYNREIRDWNPYNEPAHAGNANVVGDVRVRFRVKAEKGAAALARITVNEDAVELEAGAGPSPGTGLKVRYRGQEIGAPPSAPSGQIDWTQEHDVDLWRADAAVVLEVDGDVVRRFELDDAPRATETRRSEVRLGVRGGAATFRELQVSRDVYFLAEIPGYSRVKFPYRVPPERYFFLGDNSSNSTDSRAWETVPAGHIVGRAFIVFWPAVPGDFAVRRIR